MSKKKFYRPILYYALRVVMILYNSLPFKAGFDLAGFFGRCAFRLIPRERNRALSHLRIAFPEKSDKEIWQIGVKAFENYGHVAAELVMLDKLIPRFKDMITLVGKEHLDQALAGGKGLIAVAAHFGNWEMLAGSLSYGGYPGAAIGRKIYYDKYNDLIIKMRAKMNLQTIYRDDSSGKALLKVLRANGILGIIGDQDVDSVDGVFVDFFGKAAFTPTAPVRLALKFDIPLIPVFMIRQSYNKHTLIVEPPIKLVATDNPDLDIVTNTQAWVFLQEKYIRRHPHLWVWNHRRWKTQNFGNSSDSGTSLRTK